MTALEKVMGSQGPARVNHLGKHTWGPDPRRLVRVHVDEADGVITAAIYGANGRQVVELERFTIESIERRPGRGGVALTLVLADGRRLESPPGGCGCGSPLKQWRPPGINRVGT